MSADRPAASDGGACGFPVPGVWSAIASPHHVPSLRFDTCTMAPETRPWNLPILPWRRLIVQRCPMGAGGDSPTHRMGPMAIALPRSCSLCSPLPLAILRHFGRAAARYVDRSMGSPHRPGTASGTCRRSPPSPLRLCQRSNPKHVGKRYVLRRNRVWIETWELRLSTQELQQQQQLIAQFSDVYLQFYTV